VSTEPAKSQEPTPSTDQKDGTLTRITKAITVTRAMWVLATVVVALTVGAINRVIGEGEARAYFEARYIDHEKRMSLVEVTQREEYTRSVLIISKLSSLEGSLDMLALLMRDRDDNKK